jgi:hypothetical protein
VASPRVFYFFIMDKIHSFFKAAAGVLFIGILLFINRNAAQPKVSSFISGSEYVKLSINGTIDTIYKYDRGYPIVSVSGKRVRLAIPAGCSEYLAVQDSIVKKSNTQDVQTFRSYISYTECIVWSYNNSDVSGVVAKRRIRNVNEPAP